MQMNTAQSRSPSQCFLLCRTHCICHRMHWTALRSATCNSNAVLENAMLCIEASCSAAEYSATVMQQHERMQCGVHWAELPGDNSRARDLYWPKLAHPSLFILHILPNTNTDTYTNTNVYTNTNTNTYTGPSSPTPVFLLYRTSCLILILILIQYLHSNWPSTTTLYCTSFIIKPFSSEIYL